MTTKKIDTSFELARYFDNGVKVTVTIKQYYDFLSIQDRDAISNMAYHRLHARYLKPH